MIALSEKMKWKKKLFPSRGNCIPLSFDHSRKEGGNYEHCLERQVIKSTVKLKIKLNIEPTNETIMNV